MPRFRIILGADNVTDKKQDIPEKGAVIQRDRQTYAISPHTAGGVCDADTLRKIADVADRYGATDIKITSAQRILLVGIKEEDLDNAWSDLDMAPGAAIGLCVRSVKVCPGTSYCRMGVQDSLGLGAELDRRYHGMKLPSKLKMGVSGCANSCAECWVKDLGFIGTRHGWRVVVGGNAGARAALAQELTTVPDSDAALALTDRIIEFYSTQTRPARIGRIIEKMGLDAFKEAVGVSAE